MASWSACSSRRTTRRRATADAAATGWADDDWTEAPELGLLARVFNQDCFNLPKVQKGLHTLRRHKPGVTMAVYQETKVRHFHALYEQWLGL